MKKLGFLSMAIVTLLAVFAVGCTTTRGYGDNARYEDRYPYGYNTYGYPYGYGDPYSYNNGYPVIIESYPSRGGRYYDRRYDNRRYDDRRYNDRRYYESRRNNYPQQDTRQQQQQYEQQRKEDSRKIEKSKESILGKKN